MKKTILLLTLISIFALFSCEEDKLKELECPQGYNLSADKKSCNDINECFFGGGCEEICTNTKGSYICECEKKGYVADENGVCADENECEIDNGGCSQNCINEDGGFHCSCKDGYVLNEDKKSCDDFNDCTESSCMGNGLCIDGVDSYTCECFDNYDGDDCELCLAGYELYDAYCLDSPSIIEWGSGSVDIGEDFVIDSDDNIYVLGYIYGTFEGNTTSGRNSIFLSKLNSDLELQWTKQFGEDIKEESRITIDDENNLYVTGSTTGNFSGVNSGLYDIILMKLNSDGDIIWKKQRGTTSSDISGDITLDKNKNIYVVGYKEGEVDPITEESEKILVIRKFNSIGEDDWIKEEYTDGENFSYNIAADENNNIYIATVTKSYFENTENIGDNDILILKYDSLGNKIWTKQLGSETKDSVSTIIIKNNEIYLTGYTNGHFTQFDKYGKGDVYLKKLDLDGNILIEKFWTEGNIHQGTGISITDDSEIYISGYSDTDGFSRTMLLKKLDNNGEVIWNREWNPLEVQSLSTSINIGKNKSLYNLGFKYSRDGNYNPFLMKFDF